MSKRRSMNELSREARSVEEKTDAARGDAEKAARDREKIRLVTEFIQSLPGQTDEDDKLLNRFLTDAKKAADEKLSAEEARITELLRENAELSNETQRIRESAEAGLAKASSIAFQGLSQDTLRPVIEQQQKIITETDAIDALLSDSQRKTLAEANRTGERYRQLSLRGALDQTSYNEQYTEQSVPPMMIATPEDVQTQKDFWHHHGNTFDSYIDAARGVPRVYEMLDSGMNLDAIRSLPELSGAVKAYFDNAPPQLIAFEGNYVVDIDGRHRVAAAQMVGLERIPAKVTHWVREKKD